MAESGSGRASLQMAWQGLARPLAAAAGAGTALLSIVHGVAVDVACLRGGLTLLGALVVTRIGSVALTRTSGARTRAVEDRGDVPKAEP